MIEALMEEEIVNKVGGRFKLSTLIQKRMVAINSGARALVSIDSNNPMEVVVQEILQDKELMKAITQGNLNRVGADPKIQKLMKNESVGKIIEKNQ